MTIPIIFAISFQPFYPNSPASKFEADHVSSDIEPSYGIDQAVVDTSTPKPVFLANDLDSLWKNIFVLSPYPWQGTDKNNAPQFFCEISIVYCCTGKYIAERQHALQPCFYCASLIPLPPRYQYWKCGTLYMNAKTNAIFSAARGYRYGMLSLSCSFIAWA